MAVTKYKKDGIEYFKVWRQMQGKVLQRNLRIPTNATPEQILALKTKAKEIELTLFPHPTRDFLTWYWFRGVPRNIIIDRTNLRLNLSRNLVNKAELVTPVKLSIGLTHTGITEAVERVSNAFYEAHSKELDDSTKVEFKKRLTLWVMRNHNS